MLNESLSELIEEYLKDNDIRNWEGDKGLRNLENLLQDLGNYKREGWMHGDIIHQFLADNPGAIVAIINWIEKQDLDEWKENIESCLPEKELNDENN